jgi:hypothetical protein
MKRLFGILTVLGLTAAVLGVWLVRNSSSRAGITDRSAAPLQPATGAASPVGRSNVVASPKVATTSAPTAPAEFRLRPFPVVSAKGPWQWTAEDGRELNVIRQLAHSDLEYQRMVEENARIQRRQLVYCTETTAARVERAKLSGETLQRLTLPALDGREVEVEITRTELNPSGLQGMVAGRVAGRADSLVTLAFKGGREAFTVVSPTDGVFLQAEPREPGEVIVKSIDPDVYASGYCGNR